MNKRALQLISKVNLIILFYFKGFNMGWRLVAQPNLLFARFSEIVDEFTHLNMSESEAFKMLHG